MSSKQIKSIMCPVCRKGKLSVQQQILSFRTNLAGVNKKGKIVLGQRKANDEDIREYLIFCDSCTGVAICADNQTRIFEQLRTIAAIRGTTKEPERRKESSKKNKDKFHPDVRQLRESTELEKVNV